MVIISFRKMIIVPETQRAKQKFLSFTANVHFEFQTCYRMV